MKMSALGLHSENLAEQMFSHCLDTRILPYETGTSHSRSKAKTGIPSDDTFSGATFTRRGLSYQFAKISIHL